MSGGIAFQYEGQVAPLADGAGLGRDPAPLQDALRAALRHVARSEEWAQARSGLMLQDIVPVELASYAPAARPPRNKPETIFLPS
jgi:hypothetical protein